jgi:predicted flap endonuclease-1-like 5' DNA nuclease
MSWFPEIPDSASVRERATASLTLPLGMANPLWLAFGAAASAGAAWWWMTRWARPVNLEAFEVARTAPEKTEAPVAVAVREPDDLTRLVGVGPRTAEALAARGVTRFAELAAWTAEEMAAFDAEMKLKGRSLREAWLDQAAALV